MSFSYNDNLRGRKTATTTTDGVDVGIAKPFRLCSITLSAAGVDGDVGIHDAASSASGEKFVVNALANTTEHVEFGPEGVEFSTGLTIDVSVGGIDRCTVTYKD